ncbi:putative glutamyl-tRNA amidotransferase subunit A [Camillea tinctor]|nr:putative glutamyl-tRNA amidotransferase subunit A [Camillea tinctor]
MSSTPDPLQTLNLTIPTLLSAYRTGSLTPSQVITTIYDRIATYPHTSSLWLTLIPRASALQRAQQLQAAHPSSSSSPLPPLYGIPFSVKDSFDVTPHPTTAACPSFSYTRASTAPCVRSLLAAGAILIGKTNMDQFGTGMTGCRSPHGVPPCAHDPAYIPGGSSSGAAVSVALGFACFALGTDTAGSVRVPAALNGVVGLKPTLGTVSTVGVVPAVPTADAVGVLARGADDARAVLGVVRAYDSADVYARAHVPPPPPWGSPVRFAAPPADLLRRVLSREYLALYGEAVAALSALGCADRTGDFGYAPFARAGALLYGGSMVAQRLVSFGAYLAAHGTAGLHPVTREVFSRAQAANHDAVRAYSDMHALQGYRRAAEMEFRDRADVLVVPSTVAHYTIAEVEADPLGTNERMGEFAHFVNPLDLCAVAVPAGRWTNANGNEMPFGVTLIAPAGRDYDVLGLGKRLMEYMGQ